MIRRFRQMLAQPVDGSSLGVVRIAVGLILFLEAVRLILPISGTSLLRVYYTDAAYLFPYRGLEWVRPLPEPWMTLLVVVLAGASLLLAAGVGHRLAGLLAAGLWGYILLLDVTRFNNHYYLEVLLAALVGLMPADRRFRVAGSESQQTTVPFWTIFVLRAQLVTVYFWAGVAKLSPEWLLHAEPIQSVLRDPTTKLRVMALLPDGFVQSFWPYASSSTTALFLSYGGAIFDLVVGPLLLLRRTRALAFALTLVFHAMNHWILFGDIGFFPVLGVLVTTVFFSPDWPARLVEFVARPKWIRPSLGWLIGGGVLFPIMGMLLGWKGRRSVGPIHEDDRLLGRWATTLVVVWVATQLFAPAAQFAMPEPLVWSGKADQFFWRMKSAVKIVTAVALEIEDRSVVGSDGAVDWSSWPGEPVLYTAVGPEHADWSKLPEFLVEFQPIHGERILYNPFANAGKLGRTSDEARARIREQWQSSFGRVPRAVPTESLSRVLEAVRSRLATNGGAEEIAARVALARDAARRVESGDLSRSQREWLLASVHQELVDLRFHGGPEVASVLRFALRYANPASLLVPSGARGSFFVVDDPALDQVEANRYGGTYAAVDVAGHQDFFGNPSRVYSSFASLSPVELGSIPALRLETNQNERVSVLWNPHSDLMEDQYRLAFVQPFLCRQYTSHVASEWRRLSGRDAKVFARIDMAVMPYQARPLVDSQVDLARCEWVVFEPLPWLGPFRREVDSRLSGPRDWEEALGGGP